MSMPLADVVTATGLSADTLRFWEREGLLPPVARSTGGKRRYSPADVARLTFLVTLRASGMPVATMREFASLRLAGEAGRPGRLALLREHRAAVVARIGALTANLRIVDAKIAKHEAALGLDSGFALRPIHHVQLAIPAGGEAACRAFWGEALGMTELTKPPVLAARGGCWFRSADLGGGALEVHLGVESPFAPARKAHPGLLVQGLKACAARLETAGVPVTWDGEFPGHHRFYAEDPFGNRLEFLEPF